MTFPEPAYVDPAPRVAGTTVAGVEHWYEPVTLTAEMIGKRSSRPQTVRAVLELYRRLSPDDYVLALTRFYQHGIERYGEDWRYSDIVTALHAASTIIRPTSYLEIGVRRGRSMAAVAVTQPGCALSGFDNWKPGYAGMDNPGPAFVEAEMRRLGHRGTIELVKGNSHETVPAYLQAHPDAWFDLIAVDGDHTPQGAAADLATVLPRLRVGGAIVFDDISHPKHMDLRAVWHRYVGDLHRFSTWEYTSLGYGIGIAVRKR